MSVLLTAVRFAHLASLVVAVGVFAFLVAVARPWLAPAASGGPAALCALDRRLVRLGGWAAGGALASALAWLAVQGAIAAGTAAAALDLLVQTSFGRVWQLRLGLLVLLTALLLLRDREDGRRDWTALRAQALALAGAAIVLLSGAGHAAATEGWLAAVHLTVDGLHALAAAIWLGGLVPLALVLLAARRPAGADAAGLAPAVPAIVRRFSALALVAMATLLATGAVNAWLLVGDVPALVGTPYGRLLLLKIALLLPVVVLAAVNRRQLAPRLARSAEGSPRRLAALARLAGNVRAELALGAVIVALAAALGVTPPARHVDPVWPFSFRLSWDVASGDPGLLPFVVGCALFAGGGVGVLLMACRRGFHPRWAVALGPAMVIYAAAGVVSALTIDAYPTTYLRPAVTYHAISVAHGEHLYRRHCASCHGPWGQGDGPAGLTLPREPADLTAKHAGDHTAGDLFWWLTHGIAGTPMPGFAEHLDEVDRWDVINFVRALAAAEEAKRLGPAVDPHVRIAAPDFTYGIGVGSAETLRDHRDQDVVHLVLFTLPGSLPRLEQLGRAWPVLRERGVRVIAVPARDAHAAYRRLGPRAAHLPIAVEGSEEITGTYRLLARTPAMTAEAPAPDHAEFLVDRQGWLRARSLPGMEGGWDDVEVLLAAAAALDREPPGVPPPDDHVH